MGKDMAKLTIGPLLFHWSAEKRRDFYYEMADMDAVDTVYLGEMICSKRTPFFDSYIREVQDRLEKSGKIVVFSTLSEVTERRDQKDVEKSCGLDTRVVEANDSAALWHLSGRPHRIGQLFNVYNENSMEFLADKGAQHFCLPAELSAESVEVLGKKARELNVGLEVQVFGRISLALSARCYHARAHDRIKANCQFVCEEDPDGMDLQTLSGEKFLTINGIQTLSYRYLNLLGELDTLQDMGVTHFRLSPHNNNMKETVQVFDDVLKHKIDVEEADRRLQKTGINVPFSNGFFYHKPGIDFTRDGAIT